MHQLGLSSARQLQVDLLLLCELIMYLNFQFVVHSEPGSGTSHGM